MRCSGSADVLAELGVNINASVAQVEACLDELGICFCFAPLMHPSMKHVAAVRKRLGIRTIFNILGPLVNPAGACYQLLGAGRPELRPLLAGAMARRPASLRHAFEPAATAEQLQIQPVAGVARDVRVG